MRNKAKVFTRYATIARVIDGDSVVANIDLGDYLFLENRTIRFSNLDTPELEGKTEKERMLAVKAKLFVESKLVIGQEYLFISTEKMDKYGRSLGAIHDAEGKDIATQLIQAGLAYQYNGGTKKDWAI